MAPEKLRWTPPYAFSHTTGSVTSYMASAAPMASLVVIGCSAVMGRMRPASQRQSIVAASETRPNVGTCRSLTSEASVMVGEAAYGPKQNAS